MKTLTIILAAGKRNGDFAIPKMIMPVYGEPLLTRNVRLAREHFGPDVVVAVSNPAIGATVDCTVMVTNRTGGSCDTMMDTARFWPAYDRVQVSLADVFYSPSSMALMVTETRPLVFYCDTQDTFAFQFRKEVFQLVERAGNQVVHHAHGREKGAGLPHLWQWLSTGQHRPVKQQLRAPTQDFDSMRDYENFTKGKTKNKALA